MNAAARLTDCPLRFAVTGATGWLGRAVLELLARELGPERFAAQVRGFAGRPHDVLLDTGLRTAIDPLAALPEHPHDVLLHYAYLTREKVQEVGLERYVTTNVGITATVLQAVRRHAPTAMFYASSGAVYGAEGARAGGLSDDPYGTLNQLDELVFRQACRDVESRVVVGRVFNVAGPWIVKPGGFAISDIIRQVRTAAGVDLRARHPVHRSYVDVEDLALVAIRAALDDEVDDVIFDTIGTEVVEVGELAARVGSVLGVPQVPIRREWDPAAAPDDYFGDGTAFNELLTRLGISLRPLEEQILRTAA